MPDQDKAKHDRRLTFSGPGRRGQRASIEKAKNVSGTLRRLLYQFRSFRTGLVLVFTLAMFGTAMTLIGPYLMGLAIDKMLAREPVSALLNIVGLMIASYVLAWIAHAGQGILIATIAQQGMRTLRAQLFSHLQKLTLKFHDSRTSGELMSRLTNDMDAISRVLSHNVTQLFSGLMTLIGILIVMFILSPYLALASMLVLPVMVGMVALVGKKTRKAFRGYQSDLGTLNGTLEETYSGQRVVLAYGQQGRVLDTFDHQNEEVRRVGTYAMTYALLVMPMMGILSNANVAVVAGLGGILALNDIVSVGLIATFITYSRRFAEPLRQLGDLYNQVQSALAGAERIFEIMDVQPSSSDAQDAQEAHDLRGDVSFDHVNFAYVSGTPVLKDICLQAQSGQRIALVGPTGAGKTTIVNLLTRFYELDAGAIYIDGTNIRNFTRDSLRRNLGIVLQQSFLFAESVAENIRYGRLDASKDEIVRAATLANADGFIRRLPHGYDTVLSERGSNLSEGQRQLLSIARVILADPRILILDEATSSVDTRTEVHIQEALHELMKGRTSFVIAHRLSTIRGADQIVVIEQGQVVEQGTHEQLLSRKGPYHRLYMSQFRNSKRLVIQKL